MYFTIAKPSRRPRYVALVLLLCWLHAGALAAQAPIYRVQQAAGPVSFLVGTMHSEDPRVTALMAQIAPLIAQVEVVAVELVPDAVTMLAVGAASLLPRGQRLETLMGDERFQRLAAAAEGVGIPPAVLQRLKPWAAAVMLGMPAAENGRFLDMQIYLGALDAGRGVVGLETAAEQLAAFEALSVDAQLLLLDEIVKNANDLPTQLEELTTVYLTGDLERLDRLARTQFQAMPMAVRSWFDDALLGRRNRRMLERAGLLFEQQATLLAVGAMHLAGESGLVRGLQRRGFTVTAVSE